MSKKLNDAGASDDFAPDIAELSAESDNEPAEETEKTAAQTAESESAPAIASQTAEEKSATEKEKEAEVMDYVMPKQTFKEHEKSNRKKSRKKKKEKAKARTDDEVTDDFLFMPAPKKRRKHRRKKKKMPLWLKILLIVLAVLLVIAIAIGLTVFIHKEIGRNYYEHYYDDLDMSFTEEKPTGEDASEAEDDGLGEIRENGRLIRHDGNLYELDEDVISTVFIGFDDSTSEIYGTDKPMSDAIYIIAINVKTGKTSIIGVSRDTMAEVDTFSVENKNMGPQRQQLAFAYSYDNPNRSGGENVCLALKRLFFGLPFKDYFAIDTDSMVDLNDAIGGVTLTSKITFYSHWRGREIYEGETITLHGEEASEYISYRDFDVLDSNNGRMERQQQYIKAFLSSIIPAAKKDISVVTNLFNVVQKNAKTTLDLSKVTYIATTVLPKMKNAGEIKYYRLQGEIKEGEFAEMYVDKNTVEDVMLSVFYKKIG